MEGKWYLSKYFALLISLGMLATGVFFQLDTCILQILKIYTLLFNKELDFLFRQAGFHYCGQFLIISGALLFIRLIIYPEDDFNKNKHFIRFSFVVIVGFFFYRMYSDAVNVPIWDDYQTILGFVNRWINNAAAPDKLYLITEPFYESRMIVLRTMTLLLLLLSNEINFKTIIIFSGLCYLFIFILLYKATALHLNKSLFFFPVAVFYFQFQSYDCLLWATAGFNFVFTLACAFLSFFLLVQNKAGTIFLSLFFALIAALTYGNGWIVFMLIISFFIYKKNYLTAVACIFGVAVIGFLYFNDSLASQTYKHNHASILDYMLYFFAFCGSAFRFFNNSTLCIISGICLFIFFIYLFLNRFYNKNMVIFLCMSFIILSALITAIYRTADGGLSQALSPRYGMYSQLLMVCSGIAGFELFTFKYPRGFYKPLLILSCIWQLLSGFMFYPEAVIRKKILVDYIQMFQFPDEEKKGHYINKQNPWLFGTNSKLEINKAIASGVYHP